MAIYSFQIIIRSASVCLSVLACSALAQFEYDDRTLKTPAKEFARPTIDGSNAQDEFLSVDAAFSPTISVRNEAVELRWGIANNYYLYQHSIKIYAVDDSGQQTDITAAFEASQALRKTDPYFGQVRVYYNQANYASAKPSESGSLEVHYQGCADLGLCYPTQKRTLVY